MVVRPQAYARLRQNVVRRPLRLWCRLLWRVLLVQAMHLHVHPAAAAATVAAAAAAATAVAVTATVAAVAAAAAGDAAAAVASRYEVRNPISGAVALWSVGAELQCRVLRRWPVLRLDRPGVPGPPERGLYPGAGRPTGTRLMRQYSGHKHLGREARYV